MDEEYAIIKEGRKYLSCQKCPSTQRYTCKHIKGYKTIAGENDTSFLEKVKLLNPQSEFKSVSRNKIPWPYDSNMCETSTKYEEGTIPFPKVLAPSISEEKCKCGNAFSTEDPVDNNWIITKEAVIYKQLHTIQNVTVCYRPTESCSCKLYYDGRDDLLLNLDNNHLFYYGWLFAILEGSCESPLPLHAAFRTSNNIKTKAQSTDVKYVQLYKAYHRFTRFA